MIKRERVLGTRPTAVLATARLLLAATTLVAVYIDPSEPTYYAAIVYTLLCGYTVYAGLLFAIERRRRSFPRLAVPIHSVDVAIAVILTLLTEGISSPFFVYFGFVLLAAAWRWGLWATIATAVTVLVLLVLEALPGSSLFGPVLAGSAPLEVNRLIARGAYIVLLAVMVGSLAEVEARARIRATVAADVVSSVQHLQRFVPSLELAAGRILRLFRSPRALLIASHRDGRAYCWIAETADAAPEGASVRQVHMNPVPQPTGAATPPRSSWYSVRSRSGGLRWQSTPGQRSESTREPPAGPLAAMPPFRRALSTSVRLSDEWRIQVMLFDPPRLVRPLAAATHLETVVAHVAPAIYNVFLLGRLRSRIQSAERARVARELHDGIVQSLIAVEMGLERVRRTGGVDAATHRDLGRIREDLTGEILNVRDLMQHLAPVDVRPDELIDVLRETVALFGQRTGVRARFDAALAALRLAPDACVELLRILQEALANIRKHSGARNVLVRLADAGAGAYSLTICDDGKGIDLAGLGPVATMAELKVARRGPAMLMQRIDTLGGTLNITSRPDEGARLEIVFPAARRQTSHD